MVSVYERQKSRRVIPLNEIPIRKKLVHIAIPIKGNPVGSDADGFFTFINHKGGMEQNNNDVACQKKRHFVAGNSRNISYRQGEERNENNREKKSCEKRGEIVYGNGIIIPAG